MEQLRQVETPLGVISYFFVQKKIKNLNLRINRHNEIVVSVPLRVPPERADEFVRDKARWIEEVLERREEDRRELEPLPGQEECRARLCSCVLRVYPLVESAGVRFPQIKIRSMKSQWGNCHWRQGYITLNTALARCPEALRDYVALHELVHFLHHDHGPGFYARMTQLMPDWQARRQALRGCSWVLEA